MRSVPLGLLDLDTIQKVAPMQARLTHNETGADSSLIVALASYYLRVSKTTQGLDAFIASLCPKYSNLFSWSGFVDGKAIPTVSAALTGITTQRSMTDLLVWSVNLGGDVDSVAAIALGLASFIPSEITPNIPQYLISQLENKTYGKDYLIALDKALGG
jgi:ADP-ribosyl-[dinitrogen reductase] hydrolase